jgi:hypothetical protein
MRKLCLVALALVGAILGIDAAAANDGQPAIDCAMVRKPDPEFRSAMRLIQPDPNVRHTIRVAVVPSCKAR